MDTEEQYITMVNSRVYWTPVALQVAVDFCNSKTQEAMEKNQHCVAQVINRRNRIVYLSIAN